MFNVKSFPRVTTRYIQLVVINTRIKDVENASVKHAVVEESTYGT